MAKPTTVYLFGDQTDDSRSYLRRLLCVEHDPVLGAFLQQSYHRLRAEVLKRSEDERRGVQFSSLLELSSVDFEGPCKVAVEHAITSIAQFGVFLREIREDGGRYPDAAETYMMGLCTGSLTAAAVSCCRSTSELLPVAVEATVLSFHVGAFASETGKAFSRDSSKENGSWAVAMPTLDYDQVERYVQAVASKDAIKATHPYVGVKSPRGVTICGPPHVLKQMTRSQEFVTVASTFLPIFAPYHAEHLYSMENVMPLLHRMRAIGGETLIQSIPIVSTVEGSGDNLVEALSTALKAILMERIDIGRLAATLGGEVHNKSTALRIVPIVSGASAMMQQILGSKINIPIEVAKPSRQPLSDYITNSTRCKIAIVGSSGRFPGAENNEALWDLLVQGRDVHKPVPASRWSSNTHVDTSEKPRKNTSATPYGCWLEDAGMFDARFFGMSPREAEQVDPAQRLALMATYEALEDGGIVAGTRSAQPSRVGVALGVTSNDWMETNSAQNIDTYMIPGGNRAFVPGRINYAFKFSGPSYAIDTACSSSLAAIDTACKALWMQEADTMIAGGTNIITNPDFTAGLDRGHFLSRTGNCKTFDDDADGYCRGEGVGVVILKRLDDAIQDGDSIKGVIVDIRTNHSAEAESITRPHPKAQADLFTRVLNGLSPASISYVEMHGTGTQVGDATEMSSVLEVVAPAHGPRRRSREEVVYLGSAKPSVGHGEAVAGVTSLIKLLLMLQHDTIPPHIGIKSRINRKFPNNLADRRVQIASAPTPWTQHGVQPRYALLNNFSAAGGNTTLLLQDAPARHVQASTPDPRHVFPIVVSAKSSSALHANACSLLRFLQEHTKPDLASLSYTTTARRMHHSHRLALNVSSATELASKLGAISQQGPSSQASSHAHSVCFVFTGQGGHYMGMGRELYRTNSTFSNHVDRYSHLAKLLGFEPFLPIIQSETGDLSSFSAEQTQLAHTSLQMALCRLWKSWGVTPSSVMGHSLGHYAALNAADVISEADTLFVVGMRARMLQEKCKPGTHCMLIVKSSKADIAHLLPETGIDIACINGPSDVVLSGKRVDIELLGEALRKKQISCTVLDTQFAFHSPQVDCILEDFEQAMQAINLGAARIPVICPRSGKVIGVGEILTRSHLVEHCRETVDIVSAIEAAKNEGVWTSRTRFVEIGHNAAITSMLKATFGKLCEAKPSLKKNMNNWTSLTETTTWLYEAGINVQWDEFHRDFATQLHILQLPRYSWDLKNYWIQYVNDWSLRKGDPPQIVSFNDRPSLLSRTIHEIRRADIGWLPATIDLRSDLSRAELRAIAHGHKVNGLPLCTPSIYADIAFTVGRYLQTVFPDRLTSKQVSLKNMTVFKALVAVPKGSQWLQTLVNIDESLRTICKFSTVDNNGAVVILHAECEIEYVSPLSAIETKDHTLNTASAIETVRAGLASGSAYRFNSTMIYRMVATLAEFDPAYRGLEEIVMDSKTMVATSLVSFKASSEDEDQQGLSVSPTYIDCFSQLAGFIMNANDASDLGKECFVNHGWGALTFYTDLSKDSVYECFVKMDRGEGSIWKGTLTVLRENTLVAIFEDLTLQGVPPRLLHQVLTSAQKAQAQASGAPLDQDIRVATRNALPAVAHFTTGDESDASLDSELEQLLAIVSEESGLDITELNDEVELADMGIDSLLSLLIAGRLREDLNFDLGSGITLFDEFRTLGQLKFAFAKSRGFSVDAALSPSSEGKETAPIETPSPSSESECTTDERPTEYDSARNVTSLVLQKASSPDSTTLFLFPDGSGSAASYISLPPLSPRITIIALISPYRHDSENMTCTLESLMASYIAEIKRRQPSDGYTLGGWSSGGVFAFCAAQMLLEKGDTVKHLLLVDSPPLRVGGGLGRLPDRFYEHCRDIGVFGQIAGSAEETGSEKQSEWLIPHFKATVNLLAGHRATPLSVSPGRGNPRVSLCWAGKCTLDGVKYGKFELEDGDSDDVRFLADPRQDFGAGAWADLFPGITCHVRTLEEWDHFNMMVGDGARDLASFITDCI